MLASIDLRSQHGRLVSARFSASVRKGVQGSCNRVATQAAGRAYRIVLQRSRPRRGEKEGSKGLPGQNFPRDCFRFSPGTAYIVCGSCVVSRLGSRVSVPAATVALAREARSRARAKAETKTYESLRDTVPTGPKQTGWLRCLGPLRLVHLAAMNDSLMYHLGSLHGMQPKN